MKATILSILLFFTVNLPDGEAGAQTIWYINRDAGGSNNGTSWANAWTSFENINWASISAGDTIYVSGGNDSTTYLPTKSNNSGSYVGVGRTSAPYYSYASGDPVVITRAWQPNHNGEVVITNIHPDQSMIFAFSGVSNVKLYGLKFIDRRTAFKGFMLYIGGGEANPVPHIDSMQTLENCEIYMTGLNHGTYIIGYKITIKDCYVEVLENTYDTAQDPFGFSGGRGQYVLDGNTIIIKGHSLTTGEHADILQFSDFGQDTIDSAVDIVIKNNLLIHDYNQTSWTAFMYLHGAKVNANFYIYNNILVSSNTASPVGGVFMYAPDTTWTLSMFIFNNTFVMNSSPDGQTIPINVGGTDSLIIKNNLVVEDANVNYMLGTEPFREANPPYNSYWYYRKVDYNAWYKLGGLTGIFSNGERMGAFTFHEWQTYEYLSGPEYNDANSDTGNSVNVTFVNKYGENITDYYTETGRDIGVNIGEAHPWILAKFPDIEYDILGNPRTGAWDIGALEYVGNQSSNVNVKGKVFLQGPFSSNSMSTTLNQSSLLPNSQPYNTPPWNYNGNESFASGPNATMVDWVLVELRSATNPAQVAARRAAVLKNNGLLLHTNGVEGINFSNLDPGSYYIAIYHRNHLAIMSSTPVPLSSNSTLYDFTTAMNKAYGQSPMVELMSGKFGMYAADGNADGVVNSVDRDDLWLIQNGNMGYLGGDFNMNSGVTVHDANQFWNINNGAMTQVP